MTDKELLELAAKAAGIKVICPASYENGGLYVGDQEDTWNPLCDDGDALRLSVKLEIAINPWAGKTVCWHEDTNTVNHEKHDCNDDEYAATRRAIVKAAAEIGKENK